LSSMSSVVAQLTAGVLAASAVALVVVATHKLLLRSQSAMVRPWVLVASGVAADSEADSTEDEAASEEVVAVVAAAALTAVEEADDSAAIVTAHPTEHLLDLEVVDLAVGATEVVDSTAVMQTWSPCHRDRIEMIVIEAGIVTETVTVPIAAVIVIVIGTMTTLDLVGMLDRSDLTTAVGMTNRGPGAATKWLYLLMDFTARRQKGFSYTQHLAFVAAQDLHGT
jgi:hypothetical protein